MMQIESIGKMASKLSIRWWWLALAMLAFALPGPCQAAELVSVHFDGLPPGPEISTVAVELHHARILSVCRFPRGWQFQTGNYPKGADDKEASSSVIGNAELGHDALSNLEEFHDYLLIEPDSPGSASLTGSIHVMSRTEENGLSDMQTLPLKPTDFQMRPAGGCP